MNILYKPFILGFAALLLTSPLTAGKEAPNGEENEKPRKVRKHKKTVAASEGDSAAESKTAASTSLSKEDERFLSNLQLEFFQEELSEGDRTNLLKWLSTKSLQDKKNFAQCVRDCLTKTQATITSDSEAMSLLEVMAKYRHTNQSLLDLSSSRFWDNYHSLYKPWKEYRLNILMSVVKNGMMLPEFDAIQGLRLEFAWLGNNPPYETYLSYFLMAPNEGSSGSQSVYSERLDYFAGKTKKTINEYQDPLQKIVTTLSKLRDSRGKQALFTNIFKELLTLPPKGVLKIAECLEADKKVIRDLILKDDDFEAFLKYIRKKVKFWKEAQVDDDDPDATIVGETPKTSPSSGPSSSASTSSTSSSNVTVIIALEQPKQNPPRKKGFFKRLYVRYQQYKINKRYW